MLEERRAAFCARLKTAREQKGVALEDIAAATKIGRSLLTGLEENDFSHWPQGIYRRAYLRSYLRAVDLPDQSIVAEFVRLFPDEKTPLLESADVPRTVERCRLSLTLADGRPERFARARKQIAAATIDLGVVCLVSGLAWWVMQADMWVSSAVVALAYYSLGTAALGRTAGSWILEDRSWRRPRKTAALPEFVPQDTLISLLRERKGLPEQPEPAMTGGLISVLVAGILRTLFLR